MSRVNSAFGVGLVALLAGACTPPPPVSKPVVPVVAPPAVEEAERGQLCSEVRADGAGSALALVVLRDAQPNECELVTVKAGVALDEAELDKTVRALFATGHYSDVVGVTEDSPRGPRLALEVVPLPKLVTLNFEGATALNREQLLKASRLSEGAFLAKDDVRRAALGLSEAFEALGFRHVKVQPALSSVEGKGSALSFTIVEGKRALLKEVRAEGLKSLDQKALDKIADKLLGGAVTEATSEELRQRLVSFLLDGGYVAGEVSTMAVTEAANGDLSGRFKITPGAKFKIGTVGLAGEPCLPGPKLEALVKGTRPGQTFSRKKVADDRKALEAACAAAGSPRLIDVATDLQLDKKRINLVFGMLPL